MIWASSLALLVSPNSSLASNSIVCFFPFNTDFRNSWFASFKASTTLTLAFCKSSKLCCSSWAANFCNSLSCDNWSFACFLASSEFLTASVALPSAIIVSRTASFSSSNLLIFSFLTLSALFITPKLSNLATVSLRIASSLSLIFSFRVFLVAISLSEFLTWADKAPLCASILLAVSIALGTKSKVYRASAVFSNNWANFSFR